MSIRVLLVDDQPLIRVGFATILGSAEDIEVVGEAGDGAAALPLVRQLTPDVVCMDVQMPGMDGIEATRSIIASGSEAAVLILTTFDRDDFLFDTLDAGASGFLLKSAGPEELIDAVRVLGRGDALLDPAVTRRVLGRVVGVPSGDAASGPPDHDAATGSAPAGGAPTGPQSAAPVAGSASAGRTAPGPVPPLTARETETLRLVARGLSNAEIAGELFVGEATVKTHVSNVLMKLGVRDRVHAVIWAFEHGLAG